MTYRFLTKEQEKALAPTDTVIIRVYKNMWCYEDEAERLHVTDWSIVQLTGEEMKLKLDRGALDEPANTN